MTVVDRRDETSALEELEDLKLTAVLDSLVSPLVDISDEPAERIGSTLEAVVDRIDDCELMAELE